MRTSRSSPEPPSPPVPREDDSITFAVVSAVAEAAGESPTDLRPLAGVVDPDALERLVVSMPDDPSGPTGVVEFSYGGYDVTVTGDERVNVSERED